MLSRASDFGLLSRQSSSFPFDLLSNFPSLLFFLSFQLLAPFSNDPSSKTLLRIVQDSLVEQQRGAARMEGWNLGRSGRGGGGWKCRCRWLENDPINSISLRDKLSSLVSPVFKLTYTYTSNYMYITKYGYIYIYTRDKEKGRGSFCETAKPIVLRKHLSPRKYFPLDAPTRVLYTIWDRIRVNTILVPRPCPSRWTKIRWIFNRKQPVETCREQLISRLIDSARGLTVCTTLFVFDYYIFRVHGDLLGFG